MATTTIEIDEELANVAEGDGVKIDLNSASDEEFTAEEWADILRRNAEDNARKRARKYQPVNGRVLAERREAALQSEHVKRLARRVIRRGEAYTKEMRKYWPKGAGQATQWLKTSWPRIRVLRTMAGKL